MNLLLLACLMVCLCTALVPPAPHSLYMWSFNFRHVLHWTAAPGSPPGLEYHVYNRCQGDKVGTTKKTWAAVQLKPEDKYRLCVRSHFNMTLSPPSKIISFTPFLKTNITAPNLTISGCGTCIQMNISLPKPHHTSGLQDIRDIYRDISFNVSLMKKGQETRTFTETKSQTVVLQYLSPGTEYCVQVEPPLPGHYLPAFIMDMCFHQPSSLVSVCRYGLSGCSSGLPPPCCRLGVLWSTVHWDHLQAQRSQATHSHYEFKAALPSGRRENFPRARVHVPAT
ncbi:hypothetical protein NQD34_015842 [Periophthalmus magnuspinnatus]|nr:hypothetical protein NQD34_015842 [Periophthalmus magnuspinnatus]